MPIPIDYAGLQQAMTHHDPYEDPLYYVDTETGEVLAVTRETEKQAYELSDPDQTEDPEIQLAWHILWRDGEPIGPELSEAEEEEEPEGAREPEGEADRSRPRSDSEGAAGITILNFAHPLTPAQRQQIEQQTGETIGHVIDASLRLDDEQPLEGELHGRSGHYPAIVRIRPVAGSNPTRYDVAEVINLQAVRERAREER